MGFERFARQARSLFFLPLAFGVVSTCPAFAQQLYAPQVAGSADGSFVVTWIDLGGDGRIVGQRVDGQGNRIREFAIDEPDLEGTSHSVAAAADGSFVVSWDRTTAEVMGQRFDRDGNPRGDSFVVSGSGYFESAAGMSADGSFLIAWAGYVDPVKAQRYDASGDPIGGVFTVGDSGGRGLRPAIAMKDDGGFVVTWAAPFALDGQLYDGSARPVGGTFRVDLPTVGGNLASTDMAADGSFVIAWQAERSREIYANRYDPTGQRLGDPFVVNPTCTALPGVATAMTTAGDFFVIWSCNRAGATSDLVAQRFDRLGQRVGAELVIDRAWPVPRTVPAAAIAGHVLVVAWVNHAEDGDGVSYRRLEIAPGSDRDGDDIPDGVDNCPTVANPEQADAAGDGYGDDCVSPDVVIPPTASLGRNPVIGVGTVIGDFVTMGDDVVLGEQVLLERQVKLGDRVEIEDFVAIGRATTVGSDVTIGYAARLDGVVSIGAGATLGDRVVVRRNAIVGNDAAIGPLVRLFAGARIGAGATVGMGARIERRATVRPGATVPPGTSVPAGTTFP